jgi:hypothetical protein
MSSKDYSQLFLEAVVCGVVVLVLGYLVGWATKPILGVSLPEACSQWNAKYMMQINLFLIGFIAHLLFEVTGANHWYCDSGFACKY